MVPQRAETESTGLQPLDQGLEHSGRPRVLARPDAQVRQQDVARPDALQSLPEQRRIAVALARKLIAQEAGGRPPHMGVATAFCGLQQAGGGFSTRCPEQRQRWLPGDLFQTCFGSGDFGAVLLCRDSELLARPRAGRWPHPEARRFRRTGIRTPIDVVVGMGCKSMALCRASLPPARPEIAQAAVAFLRLLVRSKKVTSTCWRFNTSAMRGRRPCDPCPESDRPACRMQHPPRPQAAPGTRPPHRSSPRGSLGLLVASWPYRGACWSVHTPCGDLPTLMRCTTLRSTVSMTSIFFAQRALT